MNEERQEMNEDHFEKNIAEWKRRHGRIWELNPDALAEEACQGLRFIIRKPNRVELARAQAVSKKDSTAGAAQIMADIILSVPRERLLALFEELPGLPLNLYGAALEVIGLAGDFTSKEL